MMTAVPTQITEFRQVCISVWLLLHIIMVGVVFGIVSSCRLFYGWSLKATYKFF